MTETDRSSLLEKDRELDNYRSTVQALDEEIARLKALAETRGGALRGLVSNEGAEALSYLDRGIGTKTESGKRWLAARAALSYPAAPARDDATPTQGDK